MTQKTKTPPDARPEALSTTAAAKVNAKPESSRRRPQKMEEDKSGKAAEASAASAVSSRGESKKAAVVDGSGDEPKAATTGAPREERQDPDPYHVHLKKEYILKDRASSLPPLPASDPYSSSMVTDGDDKKVDDRDSNKGHYKKNNKKQQRNNNKKKRPRDKRITQGEKVCLAIMRGETCPYGNGCKFSHDVKEFLANRPNDIDVLVVETAKSSDKSNKSEEEVAPMKDEKDEIFWLKEKLDGKLSCPIFYQRGYCPFGLMCRFGGCHLNLATGENIGKPPENHKKDTDPCVRNIISLEAQKQMRRKQYPFQSKRYDEPGKKRANEEATRNPQESKNDSTKETTTPIKPPVATVDMSPLPALKTRKLIDFSNKVYVAPLTTVGNLPFRRIMKRFGADITCGEMALATNLIMGQRSEWALLKRHEEEDVFGVQIAAGYPDQFKRVSEAIENELDSVDFVDLNLGCPLDLVCTKGSGAALMQRDQRLRDSLRGITKILSCPVTIKMRTGWDMAKPFAHQLVPKIQSWNVPGINAIMIHGRSRLQRYSKEADWDYIGRVAASQDTTKSDLPVIPVIGNGDIYSYTDYEERVLKRQGDEGGLSSCAMLARGALIKPWLPTEIKEKRHWDISATERLDILKDFVRFGLEHWGTDQQGVNSTRRFLLEWLSFLHRYVPVGLLEVVPQHLNQRAPVHMCGRNDLETLFLSAHPSDWIKISEMLLGPVPEGFQFEPKHKAKGQAST